MFKQFPESFSLVPASAFSASGEISATDFQNFRTALAQQQVFCVLETPASGSAKIDFSFVAEAGEVILFNPDGSLQPYFSTLGLFQELADQCGMLISFDLDLEATSFRVPSGKSEQDFVFFHELNQSADAELSDELLDKLMPFSSRAIFADASEVEAAFIAGVEKTDVTYSQSETMTGFFFESRNPVSNYTGTKNASLIVQLAQNPLNGVHILTLAEAGVAEIKHSLYFFEPDFNVPVVEENLLTGQAKEIMDLLLNPYLLAGWDFENLLEDSAFVTDREKLLAALDPTLTATQKLRLALDALGVPSELAAVYLDGATAPNSGVIKADKIAKNSLGLIISKGMAGVDRPGQKKGWYSRFDAYLRTNPLVDWLWTLFVIVLGAFLFYAGFVLVAGWVKFLLIGLGALVLLEGLVSLGNRIYLDLKKQK